MEEGRLETPMSGGSCSPYLDRNLPIQLPRSRLLGREQKVTCPIRALLVNLT